MKKPFFHAEIPIETVHPPIYPILSAGECPKKTMSPTLVYHWAYHGLPYLSCWIIIRNFGEMESIWNQSFGRQGFDRSLGGMQGVVGLWMILVAGPCTFPEAAQLKHVKTTGWGLSEIREPKKTCCRAKIEINHQNLENIRAAQTHQSWSWRLASPKAWQGANLKPLGTNVAW